ncbi:glycosyltransferase [Acinetobacter junii]|uniref:glycosyltransferase n=1 Tax=Acinetobacter junii TaxID=40215 RepID=UPI001250613A|nr:glycosyltransferase [Acinetobacter junii]
MKILYLITGLGGGGAEKVVADLADQMSQRGYEVKIAYLKGAVVVRPEDQSIELIYLGLESLMDAKKAYQSYKQLLMSFSPDVLHAHMVHANIFARISRIFFPIPKLICTAHSNNEGGRIRMIAYRLTHSLADLTTNVSKVASLSFEQLKAVPSGGIETIYNGIDLERFSFKEDIRFQIRKALGINSDVKMFLAVGRFHEAKNYPLLINAFCQFIKQYKFLNDYSEVKLFIAGDGDQRPLIESLIVEHNLQNKIILLGRRNDIPQLMSAADFFVLSSSYEGFGLVVAEAMCSNTFVIATDCGGIKEVLGNTGILVPINNQENMVEAFHKATRMSRIEIEKNNAKALKYAQQNFDLNKIVDDWIKLYEQ